MNPIVEFVKTVNGVMDSEFDYELLVYINVAIATLVSRGVTELDGLLVEKNTVWPEFIDSKLYSWCRAYVTGKVSLTFDPPANEIVMKARSNNIDEILMNIQLLINEREV